MKSGNVVVLGRTNAGKSTLVNSLMGKKVSITSPKPQTTRRLISGYWWDENSRIIFWDTPGIFTRAKTNLIKKINLLPKRSLDHADLIIYVIDKTRSRGDEENKIIGIVRQSDKPKIFVVNKIDVRRPDYLHEYLFLKDECNAWIEVSATKGKNLKSLMQAIVEYLPEQEPIFNPYDVGEHPSNLNPKEFIAEIIREKIFLVLRQELPYTANVNVETIEEKDSIFYIKAQILTTDDRYKKMIIGKKGQTIKEIGSMSRKEIELITSKKVYLDLEVVTDRHWSDYLPS